MFDHEIRELGAIDQHDALDGTSKFHRHRTKRGCGDDYAFVRSTAS
jgi:hypothetical protein